MSRRELWSKPAFAAATGLAFGVLLAAGPAVALEPPPQRSVLQLDVQDRVQAPPTPALALGGEFTVEMWVRLYVPGVVNESRLITKHTLHYPVTPTLVLRGETGLTPVFLVSTAEAFLEVQGSPLPVGAWCHVAAAFGNGKQSVFVNGEETSIDVPAGAKPVVSPEEFLMVGGEVRGAIRQVRVWSRALAAAEIAERAAAAIIGDEPGLVAAWPFDDGTGMVARDTGPARVALELIPGPGFGEPVWVQAATVDAPYFAPHVSRSNQELGQGGLLDLDLDGDLDLLGWWVDYVTYVAQPLRAYRNQGWSFAEDTEAMLVAPRPSFEGLAKPLEIVDFTGDGRDDVLAADYGPDHWPAPLTGGQPHLLVRQTDGTLKDETETRVPPLAILAADWPTGDVDGDGDTDFIVVAFGLNITPIETSRLLINDGLGRFAEVPGWLAGEQGRVFLCGTLFDADGDGDNDLFLGALPDIAPLTRTYDRLLLNDGSGHFSGAPGVVLPPRYRGVGWVSTDSEAADLDGDGDLDLLVDLEGDPAVGTTGRRLQLLLNEGGGTFKEASLGIPQGAVNPVGGKIRVLDMNGDGRTDLVNTNVTMTRAQVYLNTGAARFVDAGGALPVGHGALFPGDIDGDGDVDLAMFPIWHREIVALEALRPIDLATWGDFSLCVHPGHLDVPQAKSAAMQVAVNRAGFAAPVELSVTSATAGLSFAFSASTIAGDEVVALTVAAAPTVPLGTYSATVTARSGDAVHSQEIVLIVGRAPMKLRRGSRGGG